MCAGKGGGVGKQQSSILAAQMSTQDLKVILMPIMNLSDRNNCTALEPTAVWC